MRGVVTAPRFYLLPLLLWLLPESQVSHLQDALVLQLHTNTRARSHTHTHTHRRRVNDEKWGKRRNIRVTRWALGGNGKRKRELAGPVGPAVPVTVPAVYIAWSTCINNGNILNQSSECRKMPKRKAQTGAKIWQAALEASQPSSQPQPNLGIPRNQEPFPIQLFRWHWCACFGECACVHVCVCVCVTAKKFHRSYISEYVWAGLVLFPCPFPFHVHDHVHFVSPCRCPASLFLSLCRSIPVSLTPTWTLQLWHSSHFFFLRCFIFSAKFM